MPFTDDRLFKEEGGAAHRMKLPASSLTSIIRSTLAERRAVIADLGASLALRLIGLVCGFALGVVLARVLGPAEFGRYGLVTTLAALGMSIGLLGTPQLAVRELSIRSARSDWDSIHDLTHRMGGACALASAGLAGAVIVIAWAITDGDRQTLGLVVPGALLIPLMAATALIAAELRGLGRLIKGQVMDILVRPALAFLVLAAMAAAGIRFGASEALWVTVVVTLITALVSLGWIRTAVPGSGDRTIAPIRWFHIALPLGAVDMLRQLDGAYGVILMGWLAPDIALGLFRVAIACNVVVAMPVTILHIIFAPNVARLHGEGRREELQQLLSWTSATLVVVASLVSLTMALIGRPLITLVFGPVYEGSWAPLLIMSLAQLVLAFFGMGPILLAMCGGERQLIRIYLFSVSLSILAAAGLIMAFGASGAASAMVISMGLIGFFSWHYGRTHLEVDCTFLPLLRPKTA
jgi:O-antigen/teichoic acid export membrane protein